MVAELRRTLLAHPADVSATTRVSPTTTDPRMSIASLLADMVCRCQLPAAGGEPSPAEGYGPTVTSKCRVASPVSLVQPHHSTARAPGFEMLKSTGTIGFRSEEHTSELQSHLN